jgi:hypothetical protein
MAVGTRYHVAVHRTTLHTSALAAKHLTRVKAYGERARARTRERERQRESERVREQRTLRTPHHTLLILIMRIPFTPQIMEVVTAR